MNVLEAIYQRRSIGKVKDDPVDQTLIEELLAAATWAPNHHLTEPWRFFVLRGKGRERLGQVMAAIAQEGMDDPQSAENQVILEKQAAKALRAPVIIAVACQPSLEAKVIELDELGAVHAAVQNILLAAHAHNLGAVWRTGKITNHPLMKDLFGLEERDYMVGFIYIGYPDGLKPGKKRTSYLEKTVWIND